MNVPNLRGNTGSDLQSQSEYFSAGVLQLTSMKCGKPLPPGSPLGKNKHCRLFANVIWLWSAQQPFWVYAIHNYMSAWGRFTASDLGARLVWEWEADWLSMCRDGAWVCACLWKCVCANMYMWHVRMSVRVGVSVGDATSACARDDWCFCRKISFSANVWIPLCV